MPESRVPLSGWVVVDLSTGIAGGYCTKILADGGADVLKVEPPAGDPLRRWSASGAPVAEGDDGALFQFLAASKRSIVADSAQPTDLEELGPSSTGRTRWCGRRDLLWPSFPRCVQPRSGATTRI